MKKIDFFVVFLFLSMGLMSCNTPSSGGSGGSSLSNSASATTAPLYQFKVTVGGGSTLVLDPYAPSMAEWINNSRSFNFTNGSPLSKPATPTDAAFSGTSVQLPNATLGPVFDGNGNVVFNMWQPTATAVSVQVYSCDAKGNWTTTSYPMTKQSNGVWSSQSLAVSSLPVSAVAGTLNADTSGYGAVVNPSAVAPTSNGGTMLPYYTGSNNGFSTSYPYKSNRDAIIYETDIRDFTVDPALGLTHPMGTYRALIDMLPHIKNLGVTHIQILSPLENFYYDQSKIPYRETNIATSGANYNWGYDPQNYFTPTGMYSAKPADPTSRIAELKDLINAIHAAGMGVILDVVYNHTAYNGILGKAVDGYYYRSTIDNGAGSGDISSESPMVRKLIVDSIYQWVNIYHVDGFRFDLMGVLDTQTIKDAYNVAHSLNPNVLFLGEGWQGFYSGATTDYQGNSINSSDQNYVGAFNGLDIGMFSDSFRDTLKNGYPNDGKPAFMTGAAQGYNVLLKDIQGNPNDGGMNNNGTPEWATKSGGSFSTNNVVNYLSAHDNLCLYDDVAAADGLTTSSSDYNQALQRMEIGYTALFTSQGTAFMQAGDEIFRSKEVGSLLANSQASSTGKRYFDSNSYNSTDAVNQILFDSSESYPIAKVSVSPYKGDPIAGNFTNYDTTTVGYKLYKYVQGLIQIRKSTDAFRLPDSMISNYVVGIPSDQGTSNVLSFGFSAKSSDGAHTFYVFLNADKLSSHTFTPSVDLTTGTVLADGVSAGLPGTPATSYATSMNNLTVTSSKVTVGPLSAGIIEM